MQVEWQWMARGAKSAMTEPDKDEERRRRNTKNWVLFAVLVGFVVLVYFVSIVRMSRGVP
jgi:hypothetical protein